MKWGNYPKQTKLAGSKWVYYLALALGAAFTLGANLKWMG